MISLRSCMLTVTTALLALGTFGEAGATDRSTGSVRKARVAVEQGDDGLYIASRPELFAGKPVRIFCEHLRNPEWGVMSCRSNGASIVVDTRLLNDGALRHAFDNCQGMTSTCSGTVSGVVEFANGVTRIVKADIEFSDN